jgi:hypothetical protein
VTAKPTEPYTSSLSPAWPTTPAPAYVARRTAEGKSKKEIIRCLKRYIARELYKVLSSPKSQTTPEKDLVKAA